MLVVIRQIDIRRQFLVVNDLEHDISINGKRPIRTFASRQQLNRQ
jgi:hypothetical protein